MHLEEGEISNDSDDDINPYIPLARPGIANVIPEVKKYDDDDDDDTSELKRRKNVIGSSDSDSDGCVGGKMMKLSKPVRSKRYDIWNKDPNDFLTDVLTKVSVDETPEKDRNVENYLVRRWKPEGPRKRKNARNRQKEVDVLHPDADPKIIKALETTEENTAKEIAVDMALKMEEPNYLLVAKIVETIGKAKSIELFEKTRSIERDGGMTVLSGNRKRTSGGVFIALVKEDRHITGVQRNEIFQFCKPLDPIPKLKRKKKSTKKDKKKKNLSHPKDLSNPPPSPDVDAQLPPLPLRRDVVTYEDIF